MPSVNEETSEADPLTAAAGAGTGAAEETEVMAEETEDTEEEMIGEVMVDNVVGLETAAAEAILATLVGKEPGPHKHWQLHWPLETIPVPDARAPGEPTAGAGIEDVAIDATETEVAGTELVAIIDAAETGMARVEFFAIDAAETDATETDVAGKEVTRFC